MSDPMSELDSSRMPTYTMTRDPADYTPTLTGKGSRISLERVYVSTFNGKRTDDPEEIAGRVMHYLRSLCATGTVKNLHAGKVHLMQSVFKLGQIPSVTVEVKNNKGSCNLGPEPGIYEVPPENVAPSGGPVNSAAVEENSKLFCDVLNFGGVRTLTAGGKPVTVHYDGTAIIAGDQVRQKMLENELKQGWTQKSQMGVHLCKDFVPLKNDTGLSRELLDSEFYYEYKIFLNCQHFELNADRNVVTNMEADEVAWIWEDFKQTVWPKLAAKAAPYAKMKRDEDAATQAHVRTEISERLKSQYADLAGLAVTRPGVDLKYAKAPKKEADVSHLLAMLVQAGAWTSELDPIAKFGQYIDSSTDILAEDSSGAALLVEVELSLPNLFRHKHPMNSYDAVVVWDLGGMTAGDSESAPWGKNGAVVPVALVNGVSGTHWHLKWGVNRKKVIVLKEVLAS